MENLFHRKLTITFEDADSGERKRAYPCGKHLMISHPSGVYNRFIIYWRRRKKVILGITFDKFRDVVDVCVWINQAYAEFLDIADSFPEELGFFEALKHTLPDEHRVIELLQSVKTFDTIRDEFHKIT